MNESIQKWLNEFTANPVESLNRLVMGYAGVVPWCNSTLREIFGEINQYHPDVLDSALENWLKEKIEERYPANTPPLVWASHLCDVFRGIANLSLPKTEAFMGKSMVQFMQWLEPLTFTEEGVNPLKTWFLTFHCLEV